MAPLSLLTTPLTATFGCYRLRGPSRTAALITLSGVELAVALVPLAPLNICVILGMSTTSPLAPRSTSVVLVVETFGSADGTHNKLFLPTRGKNLLLIPPSG